MLLADPRCQRQCAVHADVNDAGGDRRHDVVTSPIDAERRLGQHAARSARFRRSRGILLGDTPKPRVSVGIGVNWNSPFGPFRIDFAHALLKAAGRRHQALHLQRRNPILMKTLDHAGARRRSAAGARPRRPRSPRSRRPPRRSVKGIGVVNLPRGRSPTRNAYKTAEQQRPVTYKPQHRPGRTPAAHAIDGAAPAAGRQAQRRQPGRQRRNQAALQQQASAIQQIEQPGQQELQQILAPVALSPGLCRRADRATSSTAAIEAAATKQNVTLVLDAARALLYRRRGLQHHPGRCSTSSTRCCRPRSWSRRRAGCRAKCASSSGAAAQQAARAGAAPAPAAPPRRSSGR